jgi:hypothetical protein
LEVKKLKLEFHLNNIQKVTSYRQDIAFSKQLDHETDFFVAGLPDLTKGASCFFS